MSREQLCTGLWHTFFSWRPTSKSFFQHSQATLNSWTGYVRKDSNLSDPRDLCGWGPTPRLVLGGCELVRSALSRTTQPKTAVNCLQKATFGSFQATIKGCAFCSQEMFVHHTTAYIFLQRTFQFLLLVGNQSYSEPRERPTLTTIGKLFQNFPAIFWNLAVCVQGAIVHWTLAHIFWMKINF